MPEICVPPKLNLEAKQNTWDANHTPASRCAYLEALLDYIVCMVISRKIESPHDPDLDSLEHQAKSLRRQVRDTCNQFQAPSDATISQLSINITELTNAAKESATINSVIAAARGALAAVNSLNAG